MSRIEEVFASLARRGEKGLVVYLTAGDPDAGSSLAYLRAAADGGADILEVGIPFSDPMADGPTIQAASRRALDGGMTVDRALSMVRDLRKTHPLPVVLFGYYNPFFSYGVRRFCKVAKASGADGTLVVDLPYEEAGEMAPEARMAGLDWIPLASPTSSLPRIRKAVDSGSGFLYLISVTGITGARTSLPADVAAWAKAVKLRSRLPVAVGFGISTPGMARGVAGFADAAVVGSACVKIVEKHGASRTGPEALRRFVRSLKKELR
ncbi:MAG: tryptophan synthase subunit alpha [Deltaproteobacteria bacterium]|nr:tryptophan synthase subunit alpha [Deltaproteobacteria bacterium]